jgi:DNA-binding HxlR family transcriptional regulator
MTGKTNHRFYSKGRRKNKTRNIYDQQIDRAIVNVLSQIERMSNGQLKREVEKRCKRTISSNIWSAHLKRMQIDNYLLKDDTLQRNQKVFYSLTEYAKQLRDLKLLRIYPEHIRFRQIYANLFFSIIEGNTYEGVDLESIQNEIHMNKQQLCIDSITKKSLELLYPDGHEPELKPEILLPVFMVIHYKPTSLGVKIREYTIYTENIFYKNRVEYTTYRYTVPGVSVEDLFKLCMTDCESALELLLRRNIIRPMDFRGKTRYVIADPALTDFVTEFKSYYQLEDEYLNLKWQILSRPTLNEEQSKRFFYSDMSAKFFNQCELQRHQYKQAIILMTNETWLNRTTVRLENIIIKFGRIRVGYLNYINKNREIINKYHFLNEILLISLLFSELFAATNNQKQVEEIR